MSFRLEKEMYGAALEHLPGFFNLNGSYGYGIGIPISYRVADIGFVPLRTQTSHTRQARTLCSLNLAGIWTLAKIVASEKVPQGEFSTTLGSLGSDNHRHQMISHYCDSGLIARDHQGGIEPGDWLAHQLGPVIFVELKLSRWQRALRQACFYMEKADMACVVLDGDSLNTVPKERFDQAGVGLFAAWPTHIEMLVEPARSDRGTLTEKTFSRLCAIQDLYRPRSRKWVLSQTPAGGTPHARI